MPFNAWLSSIAITATDGLALCYGVKAGKPKRVLLIVDAAVVGASDRAKFNVSIFNLEGLDQFGAMPPQSDEPKMKRSIALAKPSSL